MGPSSKLMQGGLLALAALFSALPAAAAADDIPVAVIAPWVGLRGAEARSRPRLPTTPPRRGPYQVQWIADPRYCISVDKNDFQNGKKLQLWECVDSSSQKFDFSPEEGPESQLRVANAPSKCVAVEGNSGDNGTRIELQDCNEYVLAHKWLRHWSCGKNVPQFECDTPSEARLRVGRGDYLMIKNAAFPDKCLVVDWNKGKDGAILQLWDCVGYEKYKRWRYTAA